jgi:hypothetical protein
MVVRIRGAAPLESRNWLIQRNWSGGEKADLALEDS